MHTGDADKRPKWPKRLALSPKQTFHVQGFYCCNYEGSKRWQHFVLFCVIAAVLVKRTRPMASAKDRGTGWLGCTCTRRRNFACEFVSDCVHVSCLASKVENRFVVCLGRPSDVFGECL